MKNKRLENKIEKYCNKSQFPYSVYFTECPINIGGYEDFKYFFCYHGTNSIAHAFMTQLEIEEFIDYNNRISNLFL